MKKINILIKNFIKLFNRYYPLSLVILLAMIVVIAYGQMINLYFWTDDWDLMLKVIHPELGLWGMYPGWFGSGPYRYLHTPFLPLFPLFKLNAGPYFAVAILIYFITTICVYLLFLELTHQKRSLSIVCALIFASLGYIGSYTMFHISNSYQNLGAVFFMTLTLLFLARHYRTRNYLIYLLSILFFYFSLEFENLRSHGLIFLVFGLMLLYEKWKFNIWNIMFNFAKFIPFFIIYKILYSSTLAAGGSTSVGSFFRVMTRDKPFAYFTFPFGSFSNVIIPDNITKSIFQLLQVIFKSISPELFLVALFTITVTFFIYKKKQTKSIYWLFIIFEFIYYLFNQWAFSQSVLFDFKMTDRFTSMLGATLLFSFLLVSLHLWRLNNRISRLILFGIILIFGNYIGYFVGIPALSFLITTDRYLTPSTVGTALVLGAIFSIVRYKKISLFPVLTAIYCLYLIIMMNVTIFDVVSNVSIPTKKFYETVKKITPAISPKAILLLDFESDPSLRYAINSTFPNTAFALLGGFDHRITSVYSLNEFLYNVKNGNAKIKNLLSYYINSKNVVNTSEQIQNLLLNDSPTISINLSKANITTPYTQNESSLNTQTLVSLQEKGSIGVNPQLEIGMNYISVVPVMVSVTMAVKPYDFSQVKFPYNDRSKLIQDKITQEELNNFTLDSSDEDVISRLPCKDRLSILNINKEWKDFVNNKNIKISTTSEVKYSEKEFLKDGFFSTTWGTHPLSWYANKKEEILIDLGEKKEIKKLIWINYLQRATPTEYLIMLSTDSLNWKKIKEVKNGTSRLDGEIVIEELPKENTRFVKMVITNTLTNNSPIISEIWVSSTDKENLNYSQEIIDSPLVCPTNNIEKIYDVFNSLENNIKAKIWWLTNGKENYSDSYLKEFNIIADGLPHVYQFYIPAQGTELEKIKIDSFQLPVSISLNDISVRSLTFKEIDDLGFITLPSNNSN